MVLFSHPSDFTPVCTTELGEVARLKPEFDNSHSEHGDVVIACIDTFFPSVDKPTVIVVDRSSIHTSVKIEDRLEEWTERGLTIFELPSYSPELNLIEILWRFIKYEWLDIDAYSSWDILVSSVEKILKEFGSSYVINFV